MNLRNKINTWLPEGNSGLLLGIILGDKSFLLDETKENFSNSSLAHLLVVSGAHISYLILGITFLLKIIKIGKRSGYILSILVLILFATMVGWTPAVTRATVTGILILVSKLLFRKADTYTSLAFSILIVLIYNPYSIWDVGLQLSYVATLGIIFFYPVFISILNNKFKKSIWLNEIISISLSAQIFTLPILVSIFHKFSVFFIISNILATPLFAIAILLRLFHANNGKYM